MTGPVLDAAGVEAHHHVACRGTGGRQRVAGGHLDVTLAGPDRPRRDAEPDADENGQHDRAGHERAARLRGVPAAPGGEPGDGRDDALEGKDRGLRYERDRRVDEGPVRDVHRRDECREREQDHGIGEERAVVDRATSEPRPDHHGRREHDPRDEHDEADDRLPEADEPALDQRAEALAEERLERRVPFDRVHLGQRADPQDATRCRRRRDRAEHRQLAGPPRRHHENEEAGRGDRRPPRQDRRPAGTPGGEALPQEEESEGDADEDAVVASEHRQAHEGARRDERPGAALERPGAEPQGAEDDRLVQREVVRLGHEHHRGRDGDEDGGPDGDVTTRPGLDREGPGHRRGERTDQGEGQG